MAIELTANNFDETINNFEWVLIDYWAAWCGPCRAMAPVIEEIAELYPQLVVASLDIEEPSNAAIVASKGVRGIPYFQLWHNGTLVTDAVGAQPKAKFAQWVKEIISN